MELKRAQASRLTNADLRRALEFVHVHCAPASIEWLISRALEGLFRLFPCIVVNYGEVDHVRRTGSLVSFPPEFGSPQSNYQALGLGFQEFEPLFKNRAGRAVRLSELLSRTRLKRTRMFQEHFKPFGGQDLLVIGFERSDGLSEFFSLFRQGYFSERDEAMLNAVAAPLEAALTNARALAYLYEHRAMLESGLRTSGWNAAIVSPRGRVLLETPEVRRMLSFHYGARVAGGDLPDSLWRWMRSARDRLEKLSSTGPQEPRAFSHATGGVMLVIRMLLHPSGYLLLLREEDEKSEWKPLMRLGISQREAQVLNLIAMGKTGPDVATILGISHDTVRKHTSHILVRLRVETRTAAALAAIEARSGPLTQTNAHPLALGNLLQAPARPIGEGKPT